MGQLVQQDRGGHAQNRGNHHQQHCHGPEGFQGGGDQRVPAAGDEQAEQEGCRRDDNGSTTDTGDHPLAGR